MFVMAHEGYREAATYVRSCYGDVKSSYSSMCDRYVTTRIESHVEETAPCPFTDGTCMTPAISIDSGLLDSDLDLGITATAGNRVQVRKAITCAPIPAEQEYSVGKITVTPDLKETSGQIYYYLGRNLDEDTNFTYSVTNMSFQFASEPYVLANFHAFADNVPESEFMPIPDLKRTDADVSLLLLNRALVYTEEVTDPWFNATGRVDVDGWGVKWISPLATTAVGCVEEYQLCNDHRCTPSSGLYGMNETSARAIGYNPAQTATFHILWKAMWAVQMRYLLTGLGTDVLLAKDKLYTTLHRLSPTLPPNQWHIEMSNLYNISMALLQRRVVEHASPPQFRVRGFDADEYIIPETSSESLRLCSLQRIKTSQHTSFSVLGLAIIVVTGLLIIIFNVMLVDIVAWFRRKAARGLSQNREWIESETLQLQRMLCEAQGIGPWKGHQDAVPVTVTFGQDFRLHKGIEEEENGM
ncbi:hypothetical protein BFJ68_g17495 [Fusarium oxysporum]|uniref:Uncharacterized protein n=1 Tax=Fusarium oxysporum TaxID=5507 RepID=A0A420NRF7_FUSOX|nr:hypothetical protein BFJ68_g17495 [Fusarium oxysporum]